MKRFLAGPGQPRPRRVTLLVLGVLIMACLSLTRAALAVRDWNFLSQQPGITPLYLLVTGLAWGTTGVCVGAALWWRKPRAADWLRGLALAYSACSWLERLFLYDRPSQAAPFQPLLPGDWIFWLGFNLLLLVGIFWILGSIQKNEKWRS